MVNLILLTIFTTANIFVDGKKYFIAKTKRGNTTGDCQGIFTKGSKKDQNKPESNIPFSKY
ncbi:MAG: hypothetical protein FDW93_00550 [Bergeyella sp.]|nr:hypothetical protein [Bergeyella sp.]